MNDIRASTALNTAIVALAVAACWMTWRAVSLSEQAERSAATLLECQRLAAKIEAARSAPETARGEQTPQEELTRRIESWTRLAKIAPRQTVRIDPLAPRRVADSDYLLRGAEVELDRLTLSQLASFCAVVAAEDPRLKVSQLRLSVDRRNDASNADTEPWRCELALTYLLHSPKNSRRP